MNVRLRETWIQLPTGKTLTAILLLGYCCSAAAQNPQLQTKHGLAFATVVFTRALATETPRFYSIAIDSTASATYQSAPASLAQTGVPYTVEFTASPSLRDDIFRIVGELHFFKDSNLGLQQPNANESVNTLTFREGESNNSNINNEITYHDSTNPQVRQLTFLFEGISETLEFGRRLADLHHQRNPQISAELDHMRNLADNGRLHELYLVTPVLKEIAGDSTEDKSVRATAQAILNDSAR